MKEIVNAKITKNEKISEGVYYLKLELPYSYPSSAPGQFVNLYLNNQAKILPRPISIFDHKDHELHLVYAVVGDGTSELSKYRTNTKMRVSTPLGNGFEIPDFDPNADDSNINDILLIGGGMGIAPMHYMARTIHMKYRDSSKKPDVYAILGFSDDVFLKEDFEKYCTEIQISSEKPHDDCWEGNVMLPLIECQYNMKKNWFTCGPHKMQMALAEYAQEVDVANLQVSLEERMGCGFGTCVGCSIQIRKQNDILKDGISQDGVSQDGVSHIIRKKVCKDGPVFIGSEVVW